MLVQEAVLNLFDGERFTGLVARVIEVFEVVGVLADLRHLATGRLGGGPSRGVGDRGESHQVRVARSLNLADETNSLLASCDQGGECLQIRPVYFSSDIMVKYM